MASQPANADISVRYMLRTYRQDLRHESVLAILGFPGMRGWVLSVPGKETLVTENRGSVSAGVTTSLQGDGSLNLPVVRVLRAVKTWTDVKNITHLDMPLRLGRDLFFFKKSAYNTEDIMGSATAL